MLAIFTAKWWASCLTYFCASVGRGMCKTRCNKLPYTSVTLQHFQAPSVLTCFHLKAPEPEQPGSASAMEVAASLQLCRACGLCCGDWWIPEIHRDLALRINGHPVGNPRASVTLTPSQAHHKFHVRSSFLWSCSSSLCSLPWVRSFCPPSVLHQQVHGSAGVVCTTRHWNNRALQISSCISDVFYLFLLFFWPSLLQIGLQCTPRVSLPSHGGTKIGFRETGGSLSWCF